MNARIPALDSQAAAALVEQRWRSSIIPELQRYIAVPAVAGLRSGLGRAWPPRSRAAPGGRMGAGAAYRGDLRLEIVRLQHPDGEPRGAVRWDPGQLRARRQSRAGQWRDRC